MAPAWPCPPPHRPDALSPAAALALLGAPSPPSALAAAPAFPRESRQLYTRSIARSVIDQAPSESRLIGAKGDLPPLISRLVDNATAIREGIVDTFSCDGRYYGYYADQDNECQIFHICVPMKQLFPDLYDDTDILQFSFICPKHTIFTQDAMVCAWRDSAFPCSEAHRLYDRNSMFFIVPAEDVRRERSDVEQATSASDSASTAAATTVTSSTTTTTTTTSAPVRRRTPTTEATTTTTQTTDDHDDPEFDDATPPPEKDDLNHRGDNDDRHDATFRKETKHHDLDDARPRSGVDDRGRGRRAHHAPVLVAEEVVPAALLRGLEGRPTPAKPDTRTGGKNEARCFCGFWSLSLA
ncbi:hypothetical protein C7M84_022031 [Penaeus vannamei]|uniref:Chitin-binding type-2 domain-containing protein n=1 Tax=Penaeus vannamei TaxID=6689 RepID=A0A423U7W6_PENVA|nr:hypothetical protein C7M84_022031 [Penaeus vannamei]